MFGAGMANETTKSISAPQQATVEEKVIQLELQRAMPPEVKQEAAQEIIAKHQFELQQNPALMQRVVRQLDAVNAYQHFRLPGKEYMVEDRRNQFSGEPVKDGKEVSKDVSKTAVKDAVKEAVKKELGKTAKESAAHLEVKDGKLVAAKEKIYANYLAARDRIGGNTEQKAAADRIDQMFSAFERMVVARFEQGKQIANESKDGLPHFLPKTDADWRAFFTTFLDRTVQKKVLLEEIRDFLMRGIVQKGAKGIFIGDMRLTDGRVEKFIRFSILAEALSKLKAMMPGDAVTAEMLGKLSSEHLMYLALAASSGRDMLASMMPTQGRFMGGAAEERAAQALGIPLDAQLSQKAKHLRTRRGLGAFIDKDDEPGDLPYQFIPWWQWGNLTRPAPTRWITRVFYGALFILSVIGVIAATIRVLKGV